MTAPAIGRISDRGTFRELSRPAARAASGVIGVRYVLPHAPGQPPLARVGYSINRHCGNAVTRNLVRRRLRSAVIQAGAALEPGAYLVTTRPGAAHVAYAELAADLRTAMRTAARRARGSR